MNDKTSTLLVKHLEEEKTLEKTLERKEEIQKIINNAKKLIYDDYNSPNTTPKLNLLNDLRKLGLKTIIKNTTNGICD